MTADENIPHPAQEAVSRMLASPLLGGPSVLADADEVILTLIGGSDLSLGDTQEAFTTITSMDFSCRILAASMHSPVILETASSAASRPSFSVSHCPGAKPLQEGKFPSALRG